MSSTEIKPVEPASAGLKTEVQGAAGGCAALVEDVEPRGLAATYWFDSATAAAPYSVAIHFTGNRSGVKGKAEGRDRFERIERVTGIAGGSGRVAITTRVQGINAGEWRITAVPIEHGAPAAGGRAAAASSARLPRRVMTTRTHLALLAQGPAVRLAAWPALVGLGFVVALVLQAMLLGRAGVEVLPVLVVSLTASVLGFAGGKAYYLVLHRKHPREFLAAGACIQGFLIVAFGVTAIAVATLRLPVGLLLDVTTPGLFLGMAIGRPGCFLTGCCAGRPTGSRWGLWSSDRRVAIRRVPVQLIEAAVSLALGVLALVLVLAVQPPIAGAIFAGALAAYTFFRQLLFTLRADSRTSRGRAVTMATCVLVLLASIAVPAFA
ncbi:MAG: prolipoprotein diacylglyceryl transferase family protein [Haloechinothrix sp.]